MEHIKKKLEVIVVFFAVFIGIVTIWTVRKQSQPKLTAVTWKLEEEADLDGNELSSYAKDPSKSKVVLTFKKDQTYRCKNLENKKIWKGTYTLSRTKSKDTYMLHLVPDQGTASYYGVYGTREYEDGTGHMSVILTTKDKILSFLAESGKDSNSGCSFYCLRNCVGVMPVSFLNITIKWLESV